jgi:hypothetical protein
MLRVEARVVAGVVDGLERQPERSLRLERTALPVCRASDADDARLVA